MSGSTSYYSDGRERAPADPVQRQQGFGFLDVLRRNPPAPAWGQDRWEQVQHYKGVIYVAVRRIVALYSGASYAVLRRTRRDRKKTTFGPGGAVAKAVPTAQRQGRDDEYTPFEDESHPLVSLVARPNRQETMGRLTAKGILQYLLTGVYPLWAVPNAAGRPVECWALRTPFLYPLLQLSRQYPNGAWRVQVSGPGWMGTPFGSAAGAVLPGEEVHRLLNPHPIVDYDGFSPLSAGDTQLDVLQAVDESRKSFLDQGTQMDAVLFVPGLGDGEPERIQQRFQDKYGGARNARKLAVVSFPAGSGEKADLKSLSGSAKDLDHQGGWEQMVKLCLGLYGVPPAVAGLTASSSYAELYAAKEQFLELQDGTFGEVADFYTQHLADPWASFPGEFVVRVEPKPIHDKELFEKQLSADAGILTVNQRHAIRNRPPVEGGDVPESIYLKQLEQKLAPPQPAPGQGPEPGEGDPGQSQGAPLAALLGGGPAAGAVPKPDNDAAEGSLPPKAGPVGKAMSALTLSGGGALVPPAGACPKPNKKLRRRQIRRAVRKALEGY